MSRLERPTNPSSNPATKFLEYKSEKKCFEYYDRELKQKIEFLKPLRFLFLEHYHVVKGWHDSTQKGIISNEVYAISKEPILVKTFGGLELGKGIYSEIKDKVKLSGGVYYRSIYVMLEDGSIANLQLKGAVIGGLTKESSLSKLEVNGYSEFYRQNNHLLDNQWFEATDFADAKKGATKFSIPIFKVAKQLTPKENDLANTAAKILQDYVNVYTGVTTVKETTLNDPNFDPDHPIDNGLDF